MASGIIDATCIPYVDVKDLIQKWFITRVEEDAFAYLIDIARDVDHLGIIGIQDVTVREKALIGLMREFLVKITKEDLVNISLVKTNLFFDTITFRTGFAQTWANKNLQSSKQWQLNFTKDAIELASR